LAPRPEVIAHRGLARSHPENTLPAFRAALEAGTDAIELDVHGTADGVVVVHHDRALRATDERPASGKPISVLTMAELRDARIGDPSVPSLAEVFREVDRQATVYVEIKAVGIEELVCKAVRPHRAWCAVHSFDHRAIARTRALAADIPRGVLMSSYLLDPIAPLRDTASRDLWQQWRLIDQSLVDRAHEYGGRVIAWTVNSVDDARRLLSYGVDGLCTDALDEMLRARLTHDE